MGTLRFFEEVVSFKIRRTFGFADYTAGAASLRNMAHHCTGCQLCVAVCPNGVLRPSEKLTSLMQPEMSYERG